MPWGEILINIFRIHPPLHPSSFLNPSHILHLSIYPPLPSFPSLHLSPFLNPSYILKLSFHPSLSIYASPSTSHIPSIYPSPSLNFSYALQLSLHPSPFLNPSHIFHIALHAPSPPLLPSSFLNPPHILHLSLHPSSPSIPLHGMERLDYPTCEDFDSFILTFRDFVTVEQSYHWASPRYWTWSNQQITLTSTRSMCLSTMLHRIMVWLMLMDEEL